MKTIFAQSSPYGKSGVAIYRISGHMSLQAAQLLSGKQTFKPRNAYFAEIKNPFDGKLIDEGVIIYFQAPKSFTGEDLVELYLHGSIAVSKIIIEVLSQIEFLRMAEPGEFSRRAFLNGKMDLTQAEGIADLIDAETSAQHNQAVRQMSGQLASVYEGWRKILLKISSYVEAFIDFPEEEIPLEILEDVALNIEKLCNELKNHLEDNGRGQKLRNGISLAIFGPPNVGKSTLMNYLANQDIAIVSEIAGTTRDFIETFIDIGGYPISLVDTAGIRSSTNDEIEREGIKRAIKKAQDADIKILVLDVNSDSASIDPTILSLTTPETITVVNKVDLKNLEIFKEYQPIYVSIKNHTNLDVLSAKIIEQVTKIAGVSEHPNITRARHRQNIEMALQHLLQLNIAADLVLAAEDLRQTTRYLSFITGKISVEEILGEIFSSFCIGK